MSSDRNSTKRKPNSAAEPPVVKAQKTTADSKNEFAQLTDLFTELQQLLRYSSPDGFHREMTKIVIARSVRSEAIHLFLVY